MHRVLNRIIVRERIIAVSAATPAEIEMEIFVAVVTVTDEGVTTFFGIAGIVNRMAVFQIVDKHLIPYSIRIVMLG